MEEVKRDIREEKQLIRDNHISFIENLSAEELDELNKKLEAQLFDFANFLEARIVLFYVNYKYSVSLKSIIQKSFEMEKIIALPVFNEKLKVFNIYKIDDYKNDIIKKDGGILIPNKDKCKIVPMDSLDIAIIPGMAFDEKGGRVGTGKRTYDRLVPKLPNTIRKVAICYENQIIPSVPTSSHDKSIDIIVSEKRVIYKI
jgi:5-formyltetrahydrofolate cyclo-ligase